MRFSGLQRSYRLYRPARLPSPAPLVVMLHGGFGTGQQAENSYGWDAKADAEGFVVLYPDGLNRAWNTGGGCCGQPAAKGDDDVGFIAAAVAEVGRTIPLDPKRIFVTGISNGGMMSYTLACRTNVFAAMAPDAATQLTSCPQAAPISVLHIHGSDDTRIRFDGAPGEGVAHIDGPPVLDVIASWRRIDNCERSQTTVDGAVTRSVARCPDGRAVELVLIAGAGHQWPGGKRSPAAEAILGLDPPSTLLNATDEIWSFFKAHPKP